MSNKMEEEGIVEGFCFSDVAGKNHTDDRESSLKKGCSETATLAAMNTGFNCNICLDFGVDPVVTFCGHLYCWPCIYKWLQVESSTSPHWCPVCKEPVTQNSLIPLYGQGQANIKGSHPSHEVPDRPCAHYPTVSSIQQDQPTMANPEDDFFNLQSELQQQEYHFNPYHYNHHRDNSYTPSSLPLGTASILLSIAGVAVAIFLWVFKKDMLSARMHYSSSHRLTEIGNNRRPRRQELQAEVWLHQLWIFLFCSALICLFFL